MAPEQTRPRSPEEVADYDRGVWDMVQHLVHPVAIYVVLQIVMFSGWMNHPSLDGPEAILFVLQFLGAWAVFYGTLLRDMGFESLAPLGLTAVAMGGAAWQFFLIEDPLLASGRGAAAFWAVQLVPAAVTWAWTFVRWRRLKSRWLRQEAS